MKIFFLDLFVLSGMFSSVVFAQGISDAEIEKEISNIQKKSVPEESLLYDIDKDKLKADISKNNNEESDVIELNAVQVLNIAKKFIVDEEYNVARILLTKSTFDVTELEIERLHLIAVIDVAEDKIDDAIEIYKTILDYKPEISSIRLRLAELYLRKGAYYKADYHFRLVAADKSLPENVQKNLMMAMYFVRQNKNWNFWFNFGAAPDNNVNNATGGEQCINYYGMILCNQLSEKEKAVGFNVSFGGNYEFKLSDNWRLRNELVVYNSTYDKSEYDDLYLGYVVGGKYVWQRGDVFAGVTTSRRWLHHQPYSRTFGGRFDLDYDFTRKFSGGISAYFTPTYYDDYADVLNGDVYGIRARMAYAFDASKYVVLKVGYEKENTESKIYANVKKSYGVGFGMDLPLGFSLYLEPSILFVDYKEERPVVKNFHFEDVKESDETKKYLLSLSNKNIKFWGFVPSLTYVYTDKSSNVWQKEYSKSTVELTMNQRF